MPVFRQQRGDRGGDRPGLEQGTLISWLHLLEMRVRAEPHGGAVGTELCRTWVSVLRPPSQSLGVLSGTWGWGSTHLIGTLGLQGVRVSQAGARRPWIAGGHGPGCLPVWEAVAVAERQGHTPGRTPGSSPEARARGTTASAQQLGMAGMDHSARGSGLHRAHKGVDELGLELGHEVLEDHGQERAGGLEDGGMLSAMLWVSRLSVTWLTRRFHIWQDMLPSALKDSMAARASPASWVPLGSPHTSRVIHFLSGVTLREMLQGHAVGVR